MDRCGSEEAEEPLLKMRGRRLGICSDMTGVGPSPKLLETINGLARRPSRGDVAFPDESILEDFVCRPIEEGWGLSGATLGGDPYRCIMFSKPTSGLGLGWDCVSSERGEVASEGRGDFKRGEGEAAGLEDAGRGRPPERRLTFETVV